MLTMNRFRTIASSLVVLGFVCTAFGQQEGKAPTKGESHYPNVIKAEVPLYPPVAQTGRMSGTVQIQVTVDHGAVIDAQLKSGENPFLANPSLANVKTWQFRPEERTTFLVTYVYRLQGRETELPENSKVKLDLPLRVTVTAAPFKPTDLH